MSGGTLNISAVGDAIDSGDTAVFISGGSVSANLASADVKALKTGNSTITITGGTLNFTLSGAQSKAISAKGDITISNADITASLSGPVVLEASGSGYDPSYSTAIKSDANVKVLSGNINLTLTSSAMGGRGISADGEITVDGGTIQITTAGNGATYTNTSGVVDSYTSAAIKSDGNLNLLAGNITLSSSGTGGKGASSDAAIVIGNSSAADSLLNLTVSTSGLRFLVS